MSLDRAFRFSVYLNLGLACACLGFAEWVFLPEATVLAGVVALLLVAVYRAEDHFSLSIPHANLVGLGIVVLAVAYYALQPFRSGGPSDLLPFPANLLPYLGPLLMVLIPAKAIRPKSDDDYWALLAVGLSAVALACSLATDATAALFLLVYLTSGVWALDLLGRRRAGRADPRWRRQAWPAARWTVLAFAAAAGLFLLTPRFGEARWELPYTNRFRIQTGFQAEAPGIDLNHTGTQETSEEVIFEVQAIDRRGQPVHLDVAQRWRTESLYVYENGRLLNRTQALNRALHRQQPGAPGGPVIGPAVAPGIPGSIAGAQADGPIGHKPAAPATRLAPAPPPPRRLMAPGQLPDLGPNQITLTFKLKTRINSTQVLADPLVFGRNQAVPVVTLARGQNYPWEVLEDGQPVTTVPFQPGTAQFRQVTIPWEDGTPGPPVTLERDFYEMLREPPRLLQLQAWTEARLDELIAAGTLPADVRKSWRRDAAGYPVPADYVRIARALAGYLATGYTYTLSLQRRHPKMDPVEEFLYETREGNCERFAAALMLMLRSLHIPAQVVLGYQGCEDHGDGTHEVRDSHAHSWVEMFLVDAGAPAETGPVTGRWLTLDATPTSGPVETEDTLASRWAQFTNWFRDYIINSTPEQRERALTAVGDWLLGAWQSLVAAATGPHWGRFWALVVLVTVVPVAARRAWRRWWQVRAIGGAPLVDFQARLLALLGRLGFQPHAGQTLLELAAAVGQSLRADARMLKVADVPGVVTAEYYRHRFSGQELSEPERQAVCARLDELEAALTVRP